MKDFELAALIFKQHVDKSKYQCDMDPDEYNWWIMIAWEAKYKREKRI